MDDPYSESRAELKAMAQTAETPPAEVAPSVFRPIIARTSRD
jgi:hypothetical protein